MSEHVERIMYVFFVIATLWLTYISGYNKGFEEAALKNDVSQSKAINALQLSAQYQDMVLQCYEGRGQ